MMPVTEQRRERLAAFLTTELNSCGDTLEQAEFIQEAISLGVGVYTIRARDASLAERHECIQALCRFMAHVMNGYAARLLDDDPKKEGSRS